MTGPLTDQFLNTLAAELDGDDTLGIILGGSHARGDATPYSDVDIACFVTEDSHQRRKRLLYREGYLVSIAIKSVAGVRADLLRPNTAIWVVPGLSGCHVLLDKDGSVGALLREIEAFEWEPLRQAATGYASRTMMLLAEMVHKIVGELLVSGDDQAVAYATSKLLSGLTEAVAVQRGVLVKSDNTYYRQVQDAAGPVSKWTAYHRLASGVDEGMTGDPPAPVRGIAALRLYAETLVLLRETMEPEHLEVAEGAEGASRVVESAGLA